MSMFLYSWNPAAGETSGTFSKKPHKNTRVPPEPAQICTKPFYTFTGFLKAFWNFYAHGFALLLAIESVPGKFILHFCL